MSVKYYTIDIESNGLKSSYHEAIEISIIRNSDRVQLTKFIKCKHPERSNWDALRITNRTMEDLNVGEDLADVVETCDKFFNSDGLTPTHRCIVGHNIISFDKRFLYAMWAECGKQFPANLWLDTITLTKEYMKKQGIKTRKFNLHASCDMVGIKKFSTAHTSKIDTRNTYLLWKCLTEEKNIDYLPFIKTFVHILDIPDDEGLDLSLLED